jgi:hypothetical protein
VKTKPGVWFARKDEIADWAMKTRDKTPCLDRGPVQKTGLSGPSAQSSIWRTPNPCRKGCAADAAAMRSATPNFPSCGKGASSSCVGIHFGVVGPDRRITPSGAAEASEALFRRPATFLATARPLPRSVMTA